MTASEIIVTDNFLDDYEQLRAHCDTIEYGDHVNPADGVSYPGISVDVPVDTVSEIVFKLMRLLDRNLTVNTVFFRMTKQGVSIPHQAHNDRTMGTHACFVYLNREADAAGGTSFIDHVDVSMQNGPCDAKQEEMWRRDTNKRDKWCELQSVGMRPNRAVVFDAARMHRQDPPEGFGTTNENGRLVLICFFTVAVDD